MATKSRSVLQCLGFQADLVGRPLPDDVRMALRSAIAKTFRSHFGRADRRFEDEAEIVRAIFADYFTGKTPREITAGLKRPQGSAAPRPLLDGLDDQWIAVAPQRHHPQ
jgi:hypothetical protein